MSSIIIPFPAHRTRRNARGGILRHPVAKNAPDLGQTILPAIGETRVKARRLQKLVAAAHRVARRAEFRAAAQALGQRVAAVRLRPCDIEARTGLSRRAFDRVVNLEVDVDAWLPRVREALARMEAVAP